MLFLADGGLREGDIKALSIILEGRYGKVKLVPVEGNPRALIVKTTDSVAPGFREAGFRLAVGERHLVPVLTSGAIGKLKRRAGAAEVNGKVHE